LQYGRNDAFPHFFRTVECDPSGTDFSLPHPFSEPLPLMDFVIFPLFLDLFSKVHVSAVP